jgi:hypothetical protein
MTTTTALFGTAPAQFIPSNRECLRPGEQPVMLTVTAPIPLSFDDMVAALFLCFDSSMNPAELAHDAFVRQLVAEGVYNEGLLALAHTRLDMADVEPGTEAHAWLTDCRAAITRVFGGPTKPAARRRTCAGRPQLAGVGA